MKYLLVFARNEAAVSAMPAEARADLRRRYEAYGTAAIASGKMPSGAKLAPPETATTVRLRGGRRLITDGPFVESTELLAGYMVLECADLDEAIEWASRHPDAENGSVEVRPIEFYKNLALVD